MEQKPINNYLEHRNQMTPNEEGMEQCNQDIEISRDGRSNTDSQMRLLHVHSRTLNVLCLQTRENLRAITLITESNCTLAIDFTNFIWPSPIRL